MDSGFRIRVHTIFAGVVFALIFRVVVRVVLRVVLCGVLRVGFHVVSEMLQPVLASPPGAVPGVHLDTALCRILRHRQQRHL